MVASCDLLEGCPAFCCNEIVELRTPEVSTPFVRIRMTDTTNNTVITVGNESSPATQQFPNLGNHAAVTYMKWSHGLGTGGVKMELEIVDDQGGSFQAFLSHLVTVMDWTKIKNRFTLLVEWGWMDNTCSTPTNPTLDTTSHVFLLRTISFNYDRGLTKYRLECVDMSYPTSESTVDGAHGEDVGGKEITLKQAIKSLWQEYYQGKVTFRRPSEPNKEDAWDFKAGKLPVLSKWEHKGEPPLQAIFRWIEPFKTERDLGIVVAFNSKSDDPTQHDELILWEGSDPACRKLRACGTNIRSIGTYIVNGGENSPVIRFTPSLQWNFQQLTEGPGNVNPTGKDIRKDKEDPNCDLGPEGDLVPKKGNQRFLVPPEAAIRAYGFDDALKEHMDSVNEHVKANGFFTGGLKADLVVQGDVELADPIALMGKFVSIVCIEPFYMGKRDDAGTCGDWLQVESCHPVLTNTSYVITGTTHEISRGQYTTTISVVLPVPGRDISLGQTFGASTGGYRLNTN